MSVQELKDQIAALPLEAQNELMAFMFHIRHREDSPYASAVAKRIEDKDSRNWLTPDEFEDRLDGKA
jgi:hypothetical protein